MGAEPFVTAGDRLLNDRAIPLQIAHCDRTKIEPCTRATALGAGWVWRVPLYSRLGTGYVYSSAFRSDDEARAEFLGHLRAIGELPADAPEPETRVIRMRVGYTRQPWIKNCVAIGLSAGFVEPLEATAIYSIDAAATRLVMNFPDKQCSPALAKEYNARAAQLTEEILDFLQMIYVTSNRTEPYWIAVREETRRSEWLRDKLEVWRLKEGLNSHWNNIARKNRTIFRDLEGYPPLAEQEFSYILFASIAMFLIRQSKRKEAAAIGERSPDNMQHLDELDALFPRAKFILIVRDGRDCAVSAWFHNLRVSPEWTKRKHRSMDAYVTSYAEDWAKDLGKAHEFADRHADRFYRIRYEDLASDTEQVLANGDVR
jgi:hypothetical protein